jgi:hypothetical protein
MGGLIEAVENDDWFVWRWAFTMLLERAKPALTNPADIYALDQAMSHQALSLWMQPPDQAGRLARCIERAAEELARELRNDPRDARDLTFATRLDEIPDVLAPILAQPP